VFLALLAVQTKEHSNPTLNFVATDTNLMVVARPFIGSRAMCAHSEWFSTLSIIVKPFGARPLDEHACWKTEDLDWKAGSNCPSLHLGL
jgi:hypothetical protein